MCNLIFFDTCKTKKILKIEKEIEPDDQKEFKM